MYHSPFASIVSKIFPSASLTGAKLCSIFSCLMGYTHEALIELYDIGTLIDVI